MMADTVKFHPADVGLMVDVDMTVLISLSCRQAPYDSIKRNYGMLFQLNLKKLI